MSVEVLRKKKRTIPEHTDRALVGMECDLCKTRYTPGYVATETNYFSWSSTDIISLVIVIPFLRRTSTDIFKTLGLISPNV